MKELDLFLCIVRKCDVDRFAEFFASYEVPAVQVIPCEGTAQYKAFNVLGIEQVEKCMFMMVLRQEQLKQILKSLVSKMHIYLPNRGIAMAIPLDSVGGQTALNRLSSSVPLKDREDNYMDTKKELIVVITAHGSTDTVMTAAREKGARGGTVIRSKGSQASKKGNFFNMAIAKDRDTVLIVTTKDERDGIMDAIMTVGEQNPDFKTIVFSMPVTATRGIHGIDSVESDEIPDITE